MKRLITTAIMTAMMMALSLSTITTASAGDNRRTAGVLIGATAGGLLGSTLGNGDGQLVATAVGALVGAGIGYEMTKEYPNRRNHRPRRVVKYEKVYKDGYWRKKWQHKKRYHRKHSHRKHSHRKYQRRDVWVCNGNGRKCRMVM